MPSFNHIISAMPANVTTCLTEYQSYSNTGRMGCVVVIDYSSTTDGIYFDICESTILPRQATNYLSNSHFQLSSTCTCPFSTLRIFGLRLVHTKLKSQPTGFRLASDQKIGVNGDHAKPM